MTTNGPDRDLQRYFDGELSPARARKVHARLRDDPRHQRQLDELGQLRHALRARADAAAEEAGLEGLWGRVRASIESQPSAGVGERLGLWLRRYWLVVAPAAAAAAVALFLLLVPGSTGEPPARNDAVVEVMEIGPGAYGTIFTIDGSDEAGETTVIWVTESSAEEEIP